MTLSVLKLMLGRDKVVATEIKRRDGWKILYTSFESVATAFGSSIPRELKKR